MILPQWYVVQATAYVRCAMNAHEYTHQELRDITRAQRHAEGILSAWTGTHHRAHRDTAPPQALPPPPVHRPLRLRVALGSFGPPPAATAAAGGGLAARRHKVVGSYA